MNDKYSIMAEKDFILIDIRNDSEVFNKHIDTTLIANQNYTVYVIPMNMIQFNVITIVNHLQWVKRVYLVCDTGRRSQYIKNKYFSTVPNIVVDPKLQMTHLQSGMNTIQLSDNSTVGSKFLLHPHYFDNLRLGGTTLTVPIKTQQGIYSIMRIVQIMYGIIFISCLGYVLYSLNKSSKCTFSKVPLYIGLLIAAMALFNGLTNTCTMSMLLKDYLN